MQRPSPLMVTTLKLVYSEIFFEAWDRRALGWWGSAGGSVLPESAPPRRGTGSVLQHSAQEGSMGVG